MEKTIFFVVSLLLICSAYGENPQENSSQNKNTKMFSMTADEMVFASKLTDENRRRFCYQFSSKDRWMAMKEKEESSLTADQIIEKIFQSSVALREKDSPLSAGK